MCVPHRRASALPCVTCVRALPTCCGPGGSRAQVLIGGPFYRSAWLGLRHKAANMALLVVIGTTAALVYSIISVVGLCAVCVCVCLCVCTRICVCACVRAHTLPKCKPARMCLGDRAHAWPLHEEAVECTQHCSRKLECVSRSQALMPVLKCP